MFGLLQEVAEGGSGGGAIPISVDHDQYLGFVGIPKPPVRNGDGRGGGGKEESSGSDSGIWLRERGEDGRVKRVWRIGNFRLVFC